MMWDAFAVYVCLCHLKNCTYMYIRTYRQLFSNVAGLTRTRPVQLHYPKITILLHHTQVLTYVLYVRRCQMLD